MSEVCEFCREVCDFSPCRECWVQLSLEAEPWWDDESVPEPVGWRPVEDVDTRGLL